MTTTQAQNPFPPKKPVPVGESIIVHYSGKPPKASTRQYKGEPITEVTFWLGIADKSYPDLIGQYHAFVVRPWISPGRPTAEPPIQASKLYKTLLAIAGQDKANEFVYHDASLDITAPDFNPDHLDFVGEEKLAKAIRPEAWRQFRGFYVAKFKEPRKNKETGQPMIADDGGIFRQEVMELSPLKAARIFTEEQLQANVSWPPPRPELGTPTPRAEDKPAQAPPQSPPADETPPAKEPTAAEVAYRIQGFIARKEGYGAIAKRLLAKREAPSISALSEDDTRLLLVLMEIEEQGRKDRRSAEFVRYDLDLYQMDLEDLSLPDARRLLTAAIAVAEAPF